MLADTSVIRTIAKRESIAAKKQDEDNTFGNGVLRLHSVTTDKTLQTQQKHNKLASSQRVDWTRGDTATTAFVQHSHSANRAVQNCNRVIARLLSAVRFTNHEMNDLLMLMQCLAGADVVSLRVATARRIFHAEHWQLAL